MKKELEGIFSDLRLLAHRKGWDTLDKLTEELQSNRFSLTILIVSSEGVESTSFCRWIKETTTGYEVIESASPLERLMEDPYSSIAANKVLALFECGRLLTADAVNALASIFFVRPSASYAVVYVGAEQIEDDEDLDLIERGAWRLLTPEQKAPSGKQDLLEHRVYLWSDSEPKEFLKNRILHDQEALTTWLCEPILCQGELERYQILSLINLAEDKLVTQTITKPAVLEVSLDRLIDTDKLLADYHTRLVGRIKTDLVSVEGQLTTSLKTLEQDLLHEVGSPLHEWIKEQSSQIDEGSVKSWVTDYIVRGIDQWKHRMSDLIDSRQTEIISDAQDLLEDVNWALVNETAKQYGEFSKYPEVLFKPIGLKVWQAKEMKEADYPHLKGKDNSQTITRALGAGFVIGAATYLVLPATVAMITCIAGTAGAALLSKLGQRELVFGQCKDYADSVIKLTVQDFLSQVHQYTQNEYRQIPEQMSKQFQTLKKILDRGISEARQPGEKKGDRIQDLELLKDLRRKVIEADISKDQDEEGRMRL